MAEEVLALDEGVWVARRTDELRQQTEQTGAHARRDEAIGVEGFVVVVLSNSIGGQAGALTCPILWSESDGRTRRLRLFQPSRARQASNCVCSSEWTPSFHAGRAVDRVPSTATSV
jgi:hypothetical protein